MYHIYLKALRPSYKGHDVEIMIFFAALMLLPGVEITLFVGIADEIGLLNTFLLCVLAGIAGVLLLKYQGLTTLLAMQQVGQSGKVPLQQMFDGFCLALAGILLILPGFFSDILAFALMIPMLRELLRQLLMKRYNLKEMTPAESDVIDAEFRRVDIERIGRDE